MKNICMKIDTELSRRLDAAAAKRGRSRSFVVREAVEQYLAGTAGPEATSCAELAGDLIGALDGPRDLASNKARLSGYGT